MAKLTGVKALSDREIEYGGERYVKTEGPAQFGDIITPRIEFYSDVKTGAYYCLEVKRDQELWFVDDSDDLRGFGPTHKIPYAVSTHHFNIFRRVENAPQSPVEIRALIEQKRAELADLEALIAPSVGDYVRVIGGYDEFKHGEIAKVSRVDKSDDSLPYEIDGIFSDKSEWVSADAVEKITPAEAKAALIAQVEALFQSAH